MKIAILCTKYSGLKDSPYLTDELADAFARHGDEVTVLLADWSDEHCGCNVPPGWRAQAGNFAACCHSVATTAVATNGQMVVLFHANGRASL